MTIAELEEAFDLHLPRPTAVGRTLGDVNAAAVRWSAAVWQEALEAGPLRLTDYEIAHGLEITRAPVFICGPHRSGTTLVRDLLDGHPELTVLPSEGTFFTNLEPRLRRVPPDQWLATVGCEWLRRLANPIYQIPYWLLGRSSKEDSPYVRFAQGLLSWWQVSEEHLARSVALWPLVAVQLAYAHYQGLFVPASRVRRWVDKTPTNERFLTRLRSLFPAAKVIHVVRDPCSVYASQKKLYEIAAEPFAVRFQVLRDLRTTFRVARFESQTADPTQYLLLRYEDLVAQPGPETDRIARFLEIEPNPILLRPTVAGQPALMNSSFTPEGVIGRVATPAQTADKKMTKAECDRVIAAVDPGANSFGYELASIGPIRRRVVRVTSALSEYRMKLSPRRG